MRREPDEAGSRLAEPDLVLEPFDVLQVVGGHPLLAVLARVDRRDVAAGPAVQHVDPSVLGEQGIAPRAAGETVRAEPTGQLVVSIAADQYVVAAETHDLVVAAEAADHIPP